MVSHDFYVDRMVIQIRHPGPHAAATPDGNLVASQNPVNLSFLVHDVAGFSALGDAPQSAAAFSLGGVENDKACAQSFRQPSSSGAIDISDR